MQQSAPHPALAKASARHSTRGFHAFPRIFGGLVLIAVSVGLTAGRGSSALATPAGTTNLTITATLGSITQTTKVAMTVQ
jgi:hypothetical protein